MPQSKAIKEWNEDDRPREKLMQHGASALSDAELLAILIGSGTKRESAVALMARILSDNGNNLAQLNRRTIEELSAYEGIGPAKAVTIIAACELGRRREIAEQPKDVKLNSSELLYQHLRPYMREEHVENAYVVLMNNNYVHQRTIQLSHGGMTETAVDIRIIIKLALQHDATIIALAHNHPSGNRNPSRDDDRLTNSLAEACRLMRIHLADHIIVTSNGYYSYRDNGKL